MIRGVFALTILALGPGNFFARYPGTAMWLTSFVCFLSGHCVPEVQCVENQFHIILNFFQEICESSKAETLSKLGKLISLTTSEKTEKTNHLL